MGNQTFVQTMIPCNCGARLYFKGDQNYLYFYCAACKQSQEISDIWKRRALVKLARQGKQITLGEYQQQSAICEEQWQKGR